MILLSVMSFLWELVAIEISENIVGALKGQPDATIVDAPMVPLIYRVPTFA